MKRAITGAMVLALATAGLTVAATPAPAQAARLGASCGDSMNPKGPGGINTYWSYRSTTLYGRNINLMAGSHINFGQHGWAEISRGTSNTAGSDRVWLDWSKNNGEDWYQCGPYSVDTAGTVGFSRAVKTGGPSVRFRACGDVLVSGVRKSTCTSWW